MAAQSPHWQPSGAPGSQASVGRSARIVSEPGRRVPPRQRCLRWPVHRPLGGGSSIGRRRSLRLRPADEPDPRSHRRDRHGVPHYRNRCGRLAPNSSSFALAVLVAAYPARRWPPGSICSCWLRQRRSPFTDVRVAGRQPTGRVGVQFVTGGDCCLAGSTGTGAEGDPAEPRLRLGPADRSRLA